MLSIRKLNHQSLLAGLSVSLLAIGLAGCFGASQEDPGEAIEAAAEAQSSAAAAAGQPREDESGRRHGNMRAL